MLVLSTEYKQVFEKIQGNQIQKFEVLCKNPKERNSGDKGDTTNWLVNKTSFEIPENVRRILSLGHKFNPPFEKASFPIERLVCDVEAALKPYEDQSKIEIRNRFVNILTNFLNQKEITTEIERRIRNDVTSTKKFIKANPGIFVTKADKGNATVILDRQNYITGMEKLFSDSKTYCRIEKCKTSSIQLKLNKMISRWKDIGAIDYTTARDLKCHNGTIARAYGLPKVHKPDCPFRPIVSCIGTPLYSLSKYMCNILKYIVGKTESNIKNSSDFRSKITGLEVPENYKIVSFDVVSLFTNIDNNLVIKIIHKKWDEIKKASKTKLSKSEFIEALELIINNCEFSFNGKLYKQKFGSPMGSPVSPMLANLVLENLEEEIFKQCHFSPAFYYRYVDDIITAVPEDRIEEFNRLLNSYHTKLQFTSELEIEGKIPFLDMLLIKESDRRLSINWYHKPTWSGRYLNFESWLPYSYKVNTVVLLTKKILELSDSKYHKENFKLLIETLMKNGYPKRMIKNIIYGTKNKNAAVTTKEPQDKKYVSVPYVKNLHEKMRTLFRRYDIEIVGRADEPLDKLVFSKSKDKISKENQSNVIYNVQCECKKNYVGQTSQYLSVRFRQHQRDGNSNDTSKSKSALSQHICNTNHEIGFGKTSVLAHESNRVKRDILEMIKIRKTNNTLNLQNDTDLLPNVYDNLLFSRKNNL